MAKTNERQLPEKLEIPFKICDNSLNRKGWRLLVEGIDTEGFLKNPVCCVQHNTWSVPVGKWKELKVENSNFTGVVEFDRNDEEAVKLYWKYKDGYMNAVSLHVMPLTESEEPALLAPGQKYSTVVTSELLEISLVTVPGQKNAVKLSTPEGSDYKLSIVNSTNQPSNTMDPETKKQEEAKEKELNDLKKKLEVQQQLNASNLVKMHKVRGVVTDDEVDHLTKLAMENYETVEKLLELRKPQEKTDTTETKKLEATQTEGKKLADQLKDFTNGDGKNNPDDRTKWSYLDWYKKDPEALSAMAEKEPERYKKLELGFQQQAKKEGLVTE